MLPWEPKYSVCVARTPTPLSPQLQRRPNSPGGSGEKDHFRNKVRGTRTCALYSSIGPVTVPARAGEPLKTCETSACLDISLTSASLLHRGSSVNGGYSHRLAKTNAQEVSEVLSERVLLTWAWACQEPNASNPREWQNLP